jgi:hypothetical protein
MTLLQLLASLAIDLVAISVLAYGMYFRRHGRRDLLLAYMALNVGVFSAVSLLSSQSVELGLGFGLFGILSIIRLRSDSITQEEIGYYFVALVLGLVSALGITTPVVTAIIVAALLAVMFLVDHPRILAGHLRQIITLDVVHADQTALRADLERRLGAEVMHATILDSDYVRETTTVDVRYRQAGRQQSGRSQTMPSTRFSR